MREKNNTTTIDDRIILGTVGGMERWLNPLDVLPLILTERMKTMTDDELLRLAFADPINRNGVRTEIYRASVTPEKYGRKQGERYVGICRAACILHFREEKARCDASNSIRHADAIDTLAAQFGGEVIPPTVEQKIESGKKSFYGFLVGLKKYCEENPSSKKSAALYAQKLAQYKQKFINVDSDPAFSEKL
jgi:hypothetical protein